MYLTFLVGYERDRGTCVYAIKDANSSDWYYFRDHHHYLSIHIDAVRAAVHQRNPRRRQAIDIKLDSNDLINYYDQRSKKFFFKTNFLNGAANYIEKVSTAWANKEIGILKRKDTLARKKVAAAQLSIPDEGTEMAEKMRQIEERRNALVEDFKKTRKS